MILNVIIRSKNSNLIIQNINSDLTDIFENLPYAYGSIKKDNANVSLKNFLLTHNLT